MRSVSTCFTILAATTLAASITVHASDLHGVSQHSPRPLAGEGQGVRAGRVETAAKPDELRLPVTRDTRFSDVGREADGNAGAASRLKLKSIQEMSLIDFDPAPLKGRTVQRAALHLKRSDREILRRVTAGTFAADWVEGAATSYEPQPGASTFNARRSPDVPWAYPGSDLTAVMLSQGGTIWHMADASPPDEQAWQQVPVDPRVVAARVAGISYGILLLDDTGSEWTRSGEEFHFRLFPNRFIYSREGGSKNAPYLVVTLGPADAEPPPAPTGLRWAADGLPDGDADVSWTVPADRGPAGTIGFLVTADDREVPRYLIPAATNPGEVVHLRLADLGLRPGGPVRADEKMGTGSEQSERSLIITRSREVTVPVFSHRVTVRAVDAAGNAGPPAEVSGPLAASSPFVLPGTNPEPFRGVAPLPTIGRARVAIVDALDKVQPLTGQMVPAQPAEYPSANHLWIAKEKRIRLAAARGETVSFQILLEGEVRGLAVGLVFETPGQAIHAEFGRYRCVASKLGPIPDPIVPLSTPIDVPSTEKTDAGARRLSLLAEIQVPHRTSAGAHHGTLVLKTAGEALHIDVTLTVWDFTLPDFLSFLPEMNCYGLPNERDYYRLAHRHRTVLNRLPYSQNGRIEEGCAPRWDGRKLDWTDWDRRFGPYLDGSAFADLPRAGVPLECFYLPLHENWPRSMEGNYNGSYWADEAFPPGYRAAFVEAAGQMARHVEDRGWHDTIFQGFLNNKNNFKARGWSRGSSPWLLDEPASFQDYWALRYYGEAFHEGAGQALGSKGGQARLLFRCDISRPQWQRDALDHVLDYNVVNGRAFYRYNRLVNERKAKFGQIVVPYGSANAIEQSNLQAVGWCLDSWTLGGDGVLPWQTIGRAESWDQADPLSLFYPGSGIGRQEPVPSIRLKAFCRGQQDVEYLVLLAQTLGVRREKLAEAVRRELRLAAEQRGTGFTGGEDAGTVVYSGLKPQDVWMFRTRLGYVLSELQPKPQGRIVDFRTPPR